MKKFQVINIGCDDVRLLFVETKSMTQEAKSQNLFDKRWSDQNDMNDQE